MTDRAPLPVETRKPSRKDRDACARKRAFQSEHHANRVGFKYGQSAYECPVCFCWHLTKKKR